MNKDYIRATRAIWAWRLFGLGELPAGVEIVAVRGTPTEELGAARSAVRQMADDDGTPITRSGETVWAVSDDEDEMATLARREALKHGMSEEELPSKLRKDD